MIDLRQGDCLELMKDIPDGSVDLVLTDPPYRTISGGKGKKGDGSPSGMLSKNDGKIFKHNNISEKTWFPVLYRILKEESHCYVMTNLINMEKYLTTARLCGFSLHNILIWKKNNCTPNRWYMKNLEYILFLRKGKAKSINNASEKSILEYDNVRNKTHPTEKPVSLMKCLILNSSKEGDVVFDPFMGSGSTGVACINTNRNFIGMELDEQYFHITEKRIKDEDGIVHVG